MEQQPIAKKRKTKKNQKSELKKECENLPIYKGKNLKCLKGSREKP